MKLPAISLEKSGGEASYHNETHQHLLIINLFPFTIPTLSFRMEKYVVKTGGGKS